MTSEPGPSRPADTARRAGLEAAVHGFESAWQRGERPDINAALAGLTGEDRAAALVELNCPLEISGIRGHLHFLAMSRLTLSSRSRALEFPGCWSRTERSSLLASCNRPCSCRTTAYS